MSCTVIFGGTGFIGCFFAKYLIDTGYSDKVYLVDIQSLDDKKSDFRLQYLSSISDRIIYINSDVRKPLYHFNPPENVNLIANFAAIHKDPGHNSSEYYETNILGAQNIVDWAEFVSCNNIIFTSSIATYGQESANEDTLCMPNTPYGISKTIAEKIHQVWQVKSNLRYLTIVRPGVVFGPTEFGNVTALIRSIISRKFIFVGNRYTAKSCIYIKDLCKSLIFVNKNQNIRGINLVTYNASYYPAPTVSDFVNGICIVKGVSNVFLEIPFKICIILFKMYNVLCIIFNLKNIYHPDRIRKFVKNNNISSSYLVKNDYLFEYDLISSFRDWMIENPEEWFVD